MQEKFEKIKKTEDWKLEDCFNAVKLNEYGYYELREKNTPEERSAYFKEKYFQEYAGATYYKEYPEEELTSIKIKMEEREYVIRQSLEKNGFGHDRQFSLLDIGCGEGFLMKYFYEKGNRVKGIDSGSYALEHFHPELLPFLEQGDMEVLLPELVKRGERYDVVNMDRVLNMVLEPKKSLSYIKELMSPASVLIIKLANDYSYLQQMLLRSGELQKEYWLDAPDKVAYYNRDGMICLLEESGFACEDFYGDTFVDFSLLNPMTNYYERPESGKDAHKTALRMEKLFHEISMEKTVEIYRLLADMGFGREIVGVFRLKR